MYRYSLNLVSMTPRRYSLYQVSIRISRFRGTPCIKCQSSKFSCGRKKTHVSVESPRHAQPKIRRRQSVQFCWPTDLWLQKISVLYKENIPRKQWQTFPTLRAWASCLPPSTSRGTISGLLVMDSRSGAQTPLQHPPQPQPLHHRQGVDGSVVDPMERRRRHPMENQQQDLAPPTTNGALARRRLARRLTPTVRPAGVSLFAFGTASPDSTG